MTESSNHRLYLLSKEITEKIQELAQLVEQLEKQLRIKERKNRPAVTIYVKKDEEEAYSALMLKELTLKELISLKYDILPLLVKRVCKKTTRGILVNMDDSMVELFVDEDNFLLDIFFNNRLGHFELTLRY